MFLALPLIALVSAAALAFTYGQTKPILDEQARQAQIAAVAAVLPEFDNNPTDEAITAENDSDIVLFPASSGGGIVGTAVRTYSTDGYGGTVELMVGFDEEGVITGTSVLSHSETPGLGAKMTEEAFQAQFVGYDPTEAPPTVVKDGGTIDAITAATISSRAFCDAVATAYRAVEAAGRVQ
jgi:electron transport complex protein RnfG